MIYTVTFNPAIDYVVYLNKPVVYDGINRSTSEEYQYGGKGINVSNVLRQLGQRTTALGFTAGYTGVWIETGLKQAGLKTDFIRVKDGMTRINVKIKSDCEGEINGTGPNITQDDMDGLYEKLDKITSEDMLVLSGSIPSCLPSDTYEKIMRYLDGRNIDITVDASGKLLLNTIRYHPFLVKPNSIELGEIFDTELKNDEQIICCAKELQKLGGRNILVSMAGDGAILLDENGKIYKAECPKGKVKNSVGAGDSMVAGFLAGYAEGGDYSYALRLGIAAGSATAFSTGLADREKIYKLI